MIYNEIIFTSYKNSLEIVLSNKIYLFIPFELLFIIFQIKFFIYSLLNK